MSERSSEGGPRWAYRLIAALAAGGVLETGYLTWAKLFDTAVACPTEGSCDTVLTSGYAYVLGVPLSVYGLLAYGTVGALAWQQLRPADAAAARGSIASPWGSLRLRDLQHWGLLGGATVLATCSAYLLFLLATQFQDETCVWCLTSATLSGAIFLASLRALRPGREAGQLAFPGAGLVLATVLGLSLAWGNVQVAGAAGGGGFVLEYQTPVVTTESTDRSLDLARRLKRAGAKFYGAFWCTHCLEQKEAFGRQALGDLPYVECYPEGVQPGVPSRAECRQPNITGFPAWVINGKTYMGDRTLDELDGFLTK